MDDDTDPKDKVADEEFIEEIQTIEDELDVHDGMNETDSPSEGRGQAHAAKMKLSLAPKLLQELENLKSSCKQFCIDLSPPSTSYSLLKSELRRIYHNLKLNEILPDWFLEVPREASRLLIDQREKRRLVFYHANRARSFYFKRLNNYYLREKDLLLNAYKAFQDADHALQVFLK